MDRLLKIGVVILGSAILMPALAPAQTATPTGAAAADGATAEDPNDKAPHERTFEEMRAHMQAHSEWSKKSGTMSDN